jgi:ribose-phosphate pyrophosphokinase
MEALKQIRRAGSFSTIFLSGARHIWEKTQDGYCLEPSKFADGEVLVDLKKLITLKKKLHDERLDKQKPSRDNPVALAMWELESSIRKPYKNDELDRAISNNSLGEYFILRENRIENYQGTNLVQSISNPVNDRLMELLLAIEALRVSGVRKINLIITYYGYARQDRIFAGQPNSAGLVARLIMQAAGHSLGSVKTFDIHNESILTAFGGVHVENEIFMPKLSDEERENAVIVAPDAGAVKRAKKIADANGLELIIAHKHRSGAGQSEVLGLIGDIVGKRAIIVDDIVDSGGTLCNCAKMLKEAGASSVRAIITHGVLSGNALEKIAGSVLESLTVSDSIDQSENLEKYKQYGKNNFYLAHSFA